MTEAALDYEVISLGIDQGIANVGFGLTALDQEGNEVILHSGVFRTTNKHSEEKRIQLIYEFINELIRSYNVKVIGLEKLFFNPAVKTAEGKSRNKSAAIMRTQMVTGVIFLSASMHSLPIADYTPGTVKKYVAGHGRASKDDVIKYITKIAKECGITLKTDHEADAIGISLTALHKYLEEKTEEGVEECVEKL